MARLPIFGLENHVMSYLFRKAIKFEVLWHFSSCFLLYHVQSCPSCFKMSVAGVLWKIFVLSSFQFVISWFYGSEAFLGHWQPFSPRRISLLQSAFYSILVLKFLVNFPSRLDFVCSIGSFVLKFQETSVFLQRFKCFLPIFV